MRVLHAASFHAPAGYEGAFFSRFSLYSVNVPFRQPSRGALEKRHLARSCSTHLPHLCAYYMNADYSAKARDYPLVKHIDINIIVNVQTHSRRTLTIHV